MPQFADGDREDYDDMMGGGYAEESPVARAAGILQNDASEPAERSRLFREAVAVLGGRVNEPIGLWEQRLTHVAAKCGSVEDLRALREAGADFSALSSTGQTPLHKAMAFNRDPGVARALVAEFGVDPNAVSKCGHLAGHKAIRLGQFQGEGMAERLDLCFSLHEGHRAELARSSPEEAKHHLGQAQMDRGFHAALTRTGKTACHLIAGYGSPEQMSAYLGRLPGSLDAREDMINARDSRGLAPIAYAASTNPNPDMISVLVDAGAATDVRSNEGYGLAHRAAAWNPAPEAVLRRLEEKGVPEGPGLASHATFVPRRGADAIPSAGWSATDLLAARYGVPREALDGPTPSANASKAAMLVADGAAFPAGPAAGPGFGAGTEPTMDVE